MSGPSNGGEDKLQFLDQTGKWNDQSDTGTYSPDLYPSVYPLGSAPIAYIVEYEAPQAVPEASTFLGGIVMLLPVGLRELRNRLRK